MRKLKNNILILGRLIPDSGKIHQNQGVFDSSGIMCTLKATTYKDPFRVYLENGISPALNTMQGGGLQPFVITEKVGIKND